MTLSQLGCLYRPTLYIQLMNKPLIKFNDNTEEPVFHWENMQDDFSVVLGTPPGS